MTRDQLRSHRSSSTLVCCWIPLGEGIILKAKETWPRTGKVYCHRVEEWPAATPASFAQEWTYRFLAAARIGLSEEMVGDLAVRGLQAAPRLAPAPPTPADVRSWATTNSIVVSDGGRTSAAVMAQYLEARARGET